MSFVLSPQQIHNRYNTFMLGRSGINKRYSSFDLCYSYFFLNRKNLVGRNLENSCLSLWAYLGSWGMIVRGNELQQHSYVSLVPIIEYIQSHPQFFNVGIQDSNYTQQMLDLYYGLKGALNYAQKNQKTMITKIMLGVYACIPAFDTNVCKSFHTSITGDLTKRNIEDIIDFYHKHQLQIDALAQKTHVLTFGGGVFSIPKSYTAAKIIDMIAFV